MGKTKTDRLSDRLSDLGDEARSRSRELADEARERSAPLRASARERAEELGEQARDRAKDRAQHLVSATHRATPDAAAGFGDLVAAVVTALAAVPMLFARLLRLAGVWVDRAADQGRDLAASVEPSKRVRRRRHARTAAWAGGAFGVGFAAGWLVHDRMQRQSAEAEPDEPTDASTEDEDEDEVAAARRRAESDAG